MIRFLGKLWRDRRGNALIIAGASLPLLVGAAGLATDTIQWVTWKRELQRAADSAAFAGVYALAQSNPAASAVATDLTKNNYTAVALKTGFPDCGGKCQIEYPPSPDWENAVKVTLAVQRTLGFSSLFLSTAPTITVSGTAAMLDSGEYCVVALGKGSGPGITIGGSSNTNMGCDGISNKKGAGSVVQNGGASAFHADIMAAAGSMPSSIIGVTTLKPNHLPLPDPYAGKFSTTVPTGTACSNFVTHRTNLGTGANPNYHLSPGCYSGFAPNGNNTYTLDPGVYYVNNTDFVLNGQDTLIGSNVTIVLTGTTPGRVSINGTSTVNLSAPTASNCGVFSGVNTCSYENMLFIQSPTATLNNNNTINGTNGSFLDGAFYFPNGALNMSGNAGSLTNCAMIVANQVVFTGNSNLQNSLTHPDGTACKANTTVAGKEVRLIG